jgi:hypothetical protein
MNKNFALVPLLLLALSGCGILGGGGGGAAGDGSGGSSGTDTSGGESSELAGGPTACIMDRNWSLDVDDAAAQLGAYMLEAGLAVVDTVGAGEQLIWFDEIGTAGSATDLTYTATVDMGEGLTMVMAQNHAGSPYGQWAWDANSDSTIVFDEWSDDYVVTTDTTINGIATPTSTTPLSAGLNGASMTVSCDGDTLTTHAEGSPFTQIWHAQD